MIQNSLILSYELKYIETYIDCYCLREQRSVTRLPAPYGSCEDPDSVDSTHNAYADFYPVKYTPPVILFYHLIFVDAAGFVTNLTVLQAKADV